jgi:SOS response regulatory protein OraA/RecX
LNGARPSSTATALTTVPVVTALRARGSGRVAVDLDGRQWRVVPLEVVYAAGLAVGSGLDRVSARALRRELRRVEARTEAVRALRARDHTTTSLEQRLADRGVARAVQRETVDAVRRAGLIDDQRFAEGRAALLAGRGAGDLLIADDLARQGVPADAARIAIGGLEPESTRAAAIIETRGRSSRTARHLAAKGFSEGTLERLVADLGPDPLG